MSQKSHLALKNKKLDFRLDMWLVKLFQMWSWKK